MLTKVFPFNPATANIQKFLNKNKLFHRNKKNSRMNGCIT